MFISLSSHLIYLIIYFICHHHYCSASFKYVSGHHSWEIHRQNCKLMVLISTHVTHVTLKCVG